jgi:hypothetical protein
MSLAFSDTTNKDGILQRIEQELGLGDAYITGNTQRLKEWTGSVNLSLDKAFHIAFKADGRWNFDDGNHTTYPILTGDIVSGQRDYSFTADSDSNLILDIFRVFYRSSTSAPYYELFPVDVQSANEGDISSFVDGLNGAGQPSRYDKTATGIFLNTLPLAAVIAGLKIYVNREGSYFTTASTTTMPGFAGLYHEYCVLEPCYRYARANSLKKQETFKRDYLELEMKIEEFYSKRDRHDRVVLSGENQEYE